VTVDGVWSGRDSQSVFLTHDGQEPTTHVPQQWLANGSDLEAHPR
jgi:hypothetical protein